MKSPSTLALASALLAGSAAAQETLHVFEGPTGGDNFGYDARNAGDVNGDGFTDFIVGAPRGCTGGKATVFSGVDGAVLHTFSGEFPGDGFGESVAGAGDVNGDGLADLIVGSWGDSTNGPGAGRARVYSGADGSTIRSFYGSPGAHTGVSVDGLGDIDGDGVDDLLVGSYEDAQLGPMTGSARIFSGADGDQLFVFFGAPSDLGPPDFGARVSAAGDVNADGVPDVIVGAPKDNQNGYWAGLAQVFSGSDGALLHTLFGEPTGDEGQGDLFGFGVGAAGDIDGDGYADVIVGAPQADVTGLDSGTARVFSGRTGAILFEFHGDSAGDWLGRAVTGETDIDGDGSIDLIVGILEDDNAFPDSGSVRAYSGVDGRILFTMPGIEPAGFPDKGYFGASVDALGDLNCDGRDDIIVGALGFSGVPPCSGSPGYVRVLAGIRDSFFAAFQGEEGSSFGRSVASAGDVNADGSPDWIVGAPLADSIVPGSGEAIVYSGNGLEELYRFHGDAGGDLFGDSVAGAGDVNADGFADLIVGARSVVNPQSGYARVYSGFDGSVLHTFPGAPEDQMGAAVSGAGDVDSDGYDDVVVAATGAGRVQVFSGVDGSILHTFHGEAPNDAFGGSVAGIGDVNLDGFDDILVGASVNCFGGSYARAFSGQDGAVLFDLASGNPFDCFGEVVSAAGDVNSDGIPDIVIGAMEAQVSGIPRGAAMVFSGGDGSLLHTLYGENNGDHFGASVSGAGDVDGDGHADILVGITAHDWNGPGSGRAAVYSGADGALINNLNAVLEREVFGASVAGLGDVDGDGFLEVIVGAPGADLNGTDSGVARVHSVFEASIDWYGSYCTAGTSASGCQASLLADGKASASSPSGFAVLATGVEGQKDGLFFFGTSGGQASPWGNGTSFQCVVPPVTRAGTLSGSGTLGACDGSFSQDLNALWCPSCPKPAKNPGVGVLVQAQLWYRDPQSTSNQSTSLSDAIEFCVWP